MTHVENACLALIGNEFLQDNAFAGRELRQIAGKIAAATDRLPSPV
jgi:hypothetical protein